MLIYGWSILGRLLRLIIAPRRHGGHGEERKGLPQRHGATKGFSWCLCVFVSLCLGGGFFRLSGLGGLCGEFLLGGLIDLAPRSI